MPGRSNNKNHSDVRRNPKNLAAPISLDITLEEYAWSKQPVLMQPCTDSCGGPCSSSADFGANGVEVGVP